MKRCIRPPEPVTLAGYRQANPQGTWEQMKDDAFNNGQQAAIDVKRALVKGQRGLCAYCERRIANGVTDVEIEASRPEQRVEHFHPKSDRTGPTNWSLHWPNMWAVCLGGTNEPPDGAPPDLDRYLPPLRQNMSCDSFKDRQITLGALPQHTEGWILAPDDVPAFPLLFHFAPDGTPEPHQNCKAQNLPGNNHPDTATLVAKTIEHLNLACPRLNRSRCIAKARLEKQIETLRKQAGGASPQQLLLLLARRLFAANIASPWPQFFTLIRWRLGAPAEDHLQSINYSG